MINSIRRATLADLNELVQLEQACFPSDPWGMAGLASHLNSPITETSLYIRDGQVAGALLLQLILPEFEILRVFTHPHFRGQGLAKALLTEAHQKLKNAGYTKGFLEVREGNTPAIILYRNRGYREAGRRQGYYTSPVEDALLMEVSL